MKKRNGDTPYHTKKRNSATLQQKRKMLRRAIAAGMHIPCYICNTRLTLDNYTLDHYIPVYAGGLNDGSNIRFCCYNCNMEKGKRIPTNPPPPMFKFDWSNLK